VAGRGDSWLGSGYEAAVGCRVLRVVSTSTLSVTLFWMSVGLSACAAPEEDPCGGAIVEALNWVGTVVSRTETLEVAPLPEGAPVELQFGSQSAWMLVPTIRVEHLAEDAEAILQLTLTDKLAQTVVSETRAKAQVVRATDGALYAVGPFLELSASDPVLGIFDWDKTDASLLVRLEPQCGPASETTAPVRLELP
jgi:hypothetical protein